MVLSVSFSKRELVSRTRSTVRAQSSSYISSSRFAITHSQRHAITPPKANETYQNFAIPNRIRRAQRIKDRKFNAQRCAAKVSICSRTICRKWCRQQLAKGAPPGTDGRTDAASWPYRIFLMDTASNHLIQMARSQVIDSS